MAPRRGSQSLVGKSRLATIRQQLESFPRNPVAVRLPIVDGGHRHLVQLEADIERRQFPFNQPELRVVDHVVLPAALTLLPRRQLVTHARDLQLDREPGEQGDLIGAQLGHGQGWWFVPCSCPPGRPAQGTRGCPRFARNTHKVPNYSQRVLGRAHRTPAKVARQHSKERIMSILLANWGQEKQERRGKAGRLGWRCLCPENSAEDYLSGMRAYPCQAVQVAAKWASPRIRVPRKRASSTRRERMIGVLR